MKKRNSTNEKHFSTSTSIQRSNVILLAFSLLAAIGCVIFIVWCNWYNMQIIASQDWPTISGSIIEHFVFEGQAAWRDADGTINSYTVYIPGLEYRYEVDSREYTSKKIHYGTTWGLPSFNTSREAKAFAAREYPEGSEVIVRYDPGNPANAFVLETLPSDTSFITIFIGLCAVFFFGVSVFLIFNLRRPLK